MSGVTAVVPQGESARTRTDPHSADAERSVLGAILIENECLPNVVALLDHPDYFFFAQHREIYRAMLALDSRSEPVDPTLLVRELDKGGSGRSPVSPEYVLRLIEECPTSANAEYYASIVRNQAILRRLMEVTREILEACHSGSADASDLVDRAEQRVFEVSESREVADVCQMKEILKECFKAIDTGHRNVTGLATGLVDLDELTCGLQPSELVILAARPSMGKTSLAMNIAEHVAVQEKKGVAFFSLEVGRTQFAQNLLCSRARVDAHKLRKGRLDKESYQLLQFAAGDLMSAPLFVNDEPNLNLTRLRARARRLKRRHDIRLVVLDYLQLLQALPDGERRLDSRQEEISMISRGLKHLARELDVPVVALSQLNRESDKREDHRPRLADLRESGALEQDADLVLLLFREEYYHPNKDDVKNKAEIIVAKQRHGPTDTVGVTFLKEILRFENGARAWMGGDS